jgi:hypothetical protein
MFPSNVGSVNAACRYRALPGRPDFELFSIAVRTVGYRSFARCRDYVSRNDRRPDHRCTTSGSIQSSHPHRYSPTHNERASGAP